ncbi:MAG TPA: NusG domain II-containing protein [Oribacterium sp.]|nr:NusG domain II-containing protein [Oribacterium sp.]
MKETIHRKRNLIMLLVLLGIILISFLAAALLQKNSGPKLEVVVQYGDQEILRVPLKKDAMYKIEDGKAEEVSQDTTLTSLGEEAYPSQHDVNLLEVKDGEVWMAESNCSNQVCVSIGKLSGSDYDFPITCLPHGLIVVIE